MLTHLFLIMYCVGLLFTERRTEEPAAKKARVSVAQALCERTESKERISMAKLDIKREALAIKRLEAEAAKAAAEAQLLVARARLES